MFNIYYITKQTAHTIPKESEHLYAHLICLEKHKALNVYLMEGSFQYVHLNKDAFPEGKVAFKDCIWSLISSIKLLFELRVE